MNNEDAVRLETARAVQQRLTDVTAYLEGARELVSDIASHVAREIGELEHGFEHFEQDYLAHEASKYEGAFTSRDVEV